MYVRYGSYAHSEGEVAFSWEVEPVRSEGGMILAMIRRANLSGALIGTSESDMDAKVAALIAAYVDGSDLALVLTSGSDSTLIIDSSECNGGSKVVRPPSFPEMRNAGYTSYLPYSITVEGEVEATDRESSIVSFSETVVQSGGGPRYETRETVQGSPIRQKVRNATIYRVTQSGSAIGLYSYPVPPSPLYATLKEAPQITRMSPRRRGSSTGTRGYTEYQIAWSYVYESPSPIGVLPNRWR